MTLLRYIRFLFILAFMLVGLGGLPAVYGQIKVQAPGSFTLSSPSEGVLRLTREGLSECGAAGTPGTRLPIFNNTFMSQKKMDKEDYLDQFHQIARKKPRDLILF